MEAASCAKEVRIVNICRAFAPALLFAFCALAYDVDADEPAIIDVAEVELSGAAIVILDVRTPEEFEAGHIPGALNVNVQGSHFEDSIERLDPTKTYIVHCSANVPQGRSEKAMDIMKREGFSDVRSLAGGITAWSAAGRALTPPPEG